MNESRIVSAVPADDPVLPMKAGDLPTIIVEDGPNRTVAQNEMLYAGALPERAARLTGTAP